MEPNSIVLIVLLVLVATAMIVLVAVNRHVAVKICCGLLGMILCGATGMAVVNDFYGYYQSWGQLGADLSGEYSAFTPAADATRTQGPARAGRVVAVQLPGQRSHLSRPGLVYLPPQYFDPSWQRTRFPVLELLHGTPGKPSDWVVHLGLAHVLDELVNDHLLGPMIVVMPTMSVGSDYQECVDAPGALDDTYITDDVRHDVEHLFRAATAAAEWGVGGYSSGGYCAANLALRHRTSWGASAIMDGYFRPTDGPAAAALHYVPSAERANDPLLEADRLDRSVRPLPAFWLSAGTGDAADFAAATAFTAALHGVERVTLYREPGAGHNFYAWQPAIPHMLTWMWAQLAPPSLRVQFPISGPVRDSVIAATKQPRSLPERPPAGRAARDRVGRHAAGRKAGDT